MTLSRDVDANNSDEQRIKDLDLIKKAQEETKPYIDSFNRRLEYYELVLRPRPKPKWKRQKRPNSEEDF